jgi:outer membrane protein OmpA-like peptidoglycan-associated protein
MRIPTLVIAALAASTALAQEQRLTAIPMTPGTVMVRAHESPQGDLEEIRVVQSASAEGVRLSRSAQVLTPEGKLTRYDAPRFVLAEDQRKARVYAFSIIPGEPERRPGSTAIGLSSAIFDELTSKGLAEARFTFGPDLVDVMIRRFDGDESVDVLLNGERRLAPAIRTSAISKRAGQTTAFSTWYLDNRDNPVGLKTESAGAPGAAPRVSQLVLVNVFDAALKQRVYERLAEGRSVDVYGFHFDSGSGGGLREESTFALKLVAAVLKDLPGTRIEARVHIDKADGTRTSADNRAQKLKAALERELPEAAERVEWSAAGAGEPAMKGDTLLTRAANRRVTLRPK